jgi:hypothetical protein
MEWSVGLDKVVMELLANRTPPTCIQTNLLAMARVFHPGQDVAVKELPCLETIRNMRAVLLCTTKSLAAYQLGLTSAWKQLHTNDTSCR